MNAMMKWHRVLEVELRRHVSDFVDVQSPRLDFNNCFYVRTQIMAFIL
jgi:hypothetical protein